MCLHSVISIHFGVLFHFSWKIWKMLLCQRYNEKKVKVRLRTRIHPLCKTSQLSLVTEIFQSVQKAHCVPSAMQQNTCLHSAIKNER